MDNLPLVTKILVNGGIAALTLLFVTVFLKQLTAMVKAVKQSGTNPGTNGRREARMEVEVIHFEKTSRILELAEQAAKSDEGTRLCFRDVANELKTTNKLLGILIDLQRKRE